MLVSATLNSFVKGKFSVLFAEVNIQEKLTLVILATLINSVATLVLGVLTAKIRHTLLTLNFVRSTSQ